MQATRTALQRGASLRGGAVRSLAYQATMITASAAKRSFTASTGSILWRRPVAVFQAGSSRRSFADGANEVQMIGDMDAFKTACEKSAGKLIIAYHTAAWCGPCKMIWPHVVQMAAQNPEVTFLKIDVDEAQDVAASNSITAMPTFLFLRDGEVKDKLVGASPPQLQQLLTKHA